MIVVVVRAVLVVAGRHVLHVLPWVMHVRHVSHRVMLLLLSHQPLEPLAQPVLILHLCRTCDGCKFLHHAVSPIGPLDGVSCIGCSIKAAVSAAQHLQLLVQEVLGALVGPGHVEGVREQVDRTRRLLEDLHDPRENLQRRAESENRSDAVGRRLRRALYGLKRAAQLFQMFLDGLMLLQVLAQLADST